MTPSRRWATLRMIPTMVGLAAFGVMTLLYMSGAPLYYDILNVVGIHPWAYPFLDGEFMYAMKKCWQEGVDVYQGVPCDVIPTNKMAYSPLWQRLPFLSDDTAARVPVGLATDILLLLSLLLLPPARTIRGVVVLSLGVCSTMVVFALERNNIDVWIYLIIVASTWLLIRSGAARFAAYAGFMAAGLLKYYPFVLFGFVLKERPARALAIFAAVASALAGFVWYYAAELAEELPNIPKVSPGGDAFGLVNLPLLLGPTVAKLAGAGLQGEAVITLILRLALSGWVVLFGIRLARRPGFSAAVGGMTERDSVWLGVGCLVIGGCYLAGQNVGYRGIYLLIVLSGLMELRRVCEATDTRSELSRVIILMLPMMWMEGIRLWAGVVMETIGVPGDGRAVGAGFVWLVRELLWLNLGRVLLAVLFVLAVRSTCGAVVFGLSRRRLSR